MKSSTKVIIGVVVVALVGASVYFGNTKLQKGNLQIFPADNTLTITKDVVSNVKTSQVIAGTVNVAFGAFKFQAGKEEVIIRKIRIRNLGTNTDGISNIGIYEGNKLLNDNLSTPQNEGITKASLGADGDPKTATFDYSANPIVIHKNTSRVFTIKANTVYNATSGQTVQFSIESIEKANKNSRPTTINVKVNETAVKYLYPTKLNFAWVKPAKTTLLTGQQVEVARFTLGADESNANNLGALIRVTGLNFKNSATATLTNFSLEDETQQTGVASEANSSNFNSDPANGSMFNIFLQQGEIRTFKILADVATTAPYQLVGFEFNSGNPLTAGTATWNIDNETTVTSIKWSDVSDSPIPSATLTSNAVPTNPQ